MASKSKKRSRRRSAVNLVDQVRRNLERGDFRRALKDARVCYRQKPTPEHRCFLEHAYVGRAQQLVRNGLVDDSRRIVRELLDLGVTEPSVEAGLPDLLLSIGMFDCLPQGHHALTDEERDRLRVKAADQAVLHPENTPQSMSELEDGAHRIRAALQAVGREDESVALGHLKDIPRRSPWADWKYFVRGLTAYYQCDKMGMLANWDRLDADRAAARIAAPLRVIAGVASPQHDSRLRSRINRLEKQATDQTLLSQLARLRQLAADHDWPQVFKTLRGVRGELRRLDAGVYRRLVSCLCGILVYDGLVGELERLSQIVDPLPIDPHWNRAKAVACDNSNFYDEDDAQRYWRKYLRDLKNLPALSPSQRDLARGLVWLHLAEYCVNDVRDLRGCRCGADHESDIEDAEQQARAAFEQCLSLAPAHAPAYVATADFHVAADRAEEAAGVFRRLLDHVPDNLEALLFLGSHYLAHGEPLKARQFALRARELKPLSKETANLLWLTHVGAARHLARTSQYDRARDELAAADRLQPARKGDYDMLARKAALEIKAGCGEAARRFVDQAQGRLGEPTALWLVMTIEAIRHELPKEETRLYQERWQHALKRRCRSETAGLMCRMLVAHLKMPQPYPQHQKHLRHLLQYVRRCSRVKWQEEDLRYVCEFLEEVEEPKLLAKFAKRGTRKCPKVAYFHWLMAQVEIEKGPARYNRKLTIDRLQEAIELASNSNDPRDQQVVEDAKRCLNLVGGAPRDFHEDEDDDYDDDDYDDHSDEHNEDRYGDNIDGAHPDDIDNVVRTICGRLGLDPEEVLEGLARARPKKSTRTRTKK